MNSNLPVQPVGATSGVTAVSAGESHGCAAVSSGGRCWGKNGSGQLADDYSNPVLQPVPTLTLVTYRPTTAAVITSALPVAAGRSVALTATVIGNNPVGLVNIKGGGNRITGCGLVALSAG